MNRLGNNFRILRQKKEWTLADAARRIEISAPAMSKIENGQSDLTLSRLNQLLELYNVSLNTVLGEEVMDVTIISRLNFMKLKLSERDAEIDQLRRKLIALHEECQHTARQ